MKLEVGKSYLKRDYKKALEYFPNEPRVVTIDALDEDNHHFPFLGSDGATYCEDGRVDVGRDSIFDLVEEA